MLASPIYMPTELLPGIPSGKRDLYCLGDIGDDMYQPRTKRPRLVHSNRTSPRHSPRLTAVSEASFSNRRAASLKAEFRLSCLIKEESPNRGLKNSCKDTIAVTDPDHSDNVSNHKLDTKVANKIPVVSGGVTVASTTNVIEKTCTFSTPSSDVESDCSENSRTSIPKSKMKQPSIVLMKMNQPVRKKEEKKLKPPIASPYVSNVVVGGYVHRMASLNARARVAAYLEPEKKYAPKKTLKSENKSTYSSTAVLKEPPSSTPVVADIKSDVGKFDQLLKFDSPKELDSKTCTQEQVACIENEQAICPQVTDIEELPYNQVGLLYNGDTMYPHAQVFLTGSTDPQFPTRILPTLVPSRLSSVKRAIAKARSTGAVNVDKKHSRKNNGWQPLGEPIKVIEYCEGASKKKYYRKYYAGLRRRSEDIYVRDCVVIKSDVEMEDKPFVAKIGSIWQEPGGYIMMTTFWYYRQDDVADPTLANECVGRELLASQHHDVNSVACIEDKCYVLGLSQYCRYHASMVKSTVSDPFNSPAASCVVPKLPETSHNDVTKVDSDSDVNLIELDPERRNREDIGPSLSELQDTDPFLVFLCYRGYNHVSGRVQNGRPN